MQVDEEEYFDTSNSTSDFYIVEKDENKKIRVIKLSDPINKNPPKD
jgi:hypothetical protein